MPEKAMHSVSPTHGLFDLLRAPFAMLELATAMEPKSIAWFSVTAHQHFTNECHSFLCCWLSFVASFLVHLRSLECAVELRWSEHTTHCGTQPSLIE